jgi:hypothetical protein
VSKFTRIVPYLALLVAQVNLCSGFAEERSSQRHTGPEATHAASAQALPEIAIHQVALIGFLSFGQKRQVILKERSYGEIVFRNETEPAFGFRIKKILAEKNTVLLDRSGREFELRMTERVVDEASGPPKWVQEWRKNIASLPEAAQQNAREQTREYWKIQWESGLSDAVLKMKPEEQLRIRAEISSSWRE